MDPDTGYEFKASSMEALVKYIVDYRAQNGLEPIEHLRASIEDYLCRQPENSGLCMEYKVRRGLWETARGAVNVLKNVFLGEKNMVSAEIADARSIHCSKCPLNVFPDKGPFIKFSDSLADSSTGGRRSARHDELGNCAACSCPLRVKVWSRGPFSLNDKEVGLMESVGCWQLEEKKDG